MTDRDCLARDFEAVRLALGDDKLNFLAFSYGTQIATSYAELFPENIRAFAMDAIVDHSSDQFDLVIATSTAEQALDRFLTWSAESEDSALYGLNAVQLFDELVTNASQVPLPAPSCNGSCRADVTGDEILFTVAGSLTYKSLASPYNQVFPTWQNVSIAIAAALEGDASGLSPALAVDEFGYSTASWGGVAVGCLGTYLNLTSYS